MASSPGPRLTRQQHDEHRLDVVQRTIVSTLVGVVFGSFAAVLALYLAISGDKDLAHGDVVGLWVMSGVLGLATAAGILLINRRRPYHPLVLLGLLPMIVSGFWILR
jgi:hypothetical protein